MLYLATQYAWFLLAAFAMGGVMGWISCTGRLRFSGPLPYLAGAWLVVAALTGLQGVNGAAALWIETGLLYLAAYLVGCGLACLIRGTLMSAMPEPVAAGSATAKQLDGVVPPIEITARDVAEASAEVSKPGDAKKTLDGAKAAAETAKPARRKRPKPEDPDKA
ncbi:hypothetical protein DWF00_21525 [Bosea caraganae]|uniref:Uncharacterized protein n=1 Tax=Bosea caraganae TaxID=2763117 RepID=A0A370L5V2_9HYPH|nr:hypothetical protein [Bosea caraganae]RDJ23224.1 hypothetical protein DWF00_21525 [Bosea caraganae]RDJ24662.1 hypothetical protein DWE98_13370 [Bosea caraganae]